MAAENAKNIETLLALYRDHGSSDYIGEPVTQLQHSLQAARLAEEEGYSNEVVLGAFFHDIGHLNGSKDGKPPMITGGLNLGIQDHAKLGQAYLEKHGVSDVISQMVGMHVDAKRYLVATNTSYYERLSDASKMTLEHQGGPMTKPEVARFKSHPLKDVVLRMRTWDEAAKEVGLYSDEDSCIQAMAYIEEKLAQHLQQRLSSTH